MKRLIKGLVLAAIFVGGTIFTGKFAIQTVNTIAQKINEEKTALVQGRIHETISLLEDLGEDPYIRSDENSYQEKAAFLTEKNEQEGLGYMMLRILDEDINIYREDIGLASNLASRDYMQKLYTTGETQVTDAFLAGADGTTINYTVASAIEEDGRTAAALMAAIYGSEIDELLRDDHSTNVLVGGLRQYMGGIPAEQFGLSVAQVLESGRKTTRAVENILVDFNEQKSGSFWILGYSLRYFTYSPVEQTSWIVMTEVKALPLIRNILIAYGCGVGVLVVLGILLLRRKETEQK
ncbi:hypothetical protein NXH76_03370 [Blautia schinkii]|nr:hypothetical protein [Blautia schinkii]